METTRVDRWVWAVRALPTRTAATEACRAGHVDVNGAGVKPAALIHVGDRVTVRLGNGRFRELEVTQVIERRVGAAVAAACFVDHTPVIPREELDGPVFVRDRSTGRPTKRDRRRLDSLRDYRRS